MQKSKYVELTHGRNMTGGQVAFIDEQGKAMIFDFKQKYELSGSSVSTSERSTLYLDIYEMSSAEYKSFRLVKKLSSAGANKLLSMRKPIDQMYRVVYSSYDTPGHYSSDGTRDFETNIKESNFSSYTKNEAEAKLIKEAQELIYQRLVERDQQKLKAEQEKQESQNKLFKSFTSNERD